MEQEEWTAWVRRAHREVPGRGLQNGAEFSELERGRAQQAHITHLVVHVEPLRVVVQFLSLQSHSGHEAKRLFSKARPRLVF